MMTNPDPYHAPDARWPRWTLLFVFSAGLGLALHAMLVLGLGEELERTLPPMLVLTGAGMMGMGCALLSELMRLSPGWSQRLHRRPDILKRAFFWAMLTPMCFQGIWPVPVVVLGAMAVVDLAPITIVFSVFAAGLFVWLHWIAVDLTFQRFSNPTHQWIAQSALWAGTIGGVLVLGGPVLPDLVIL